MAGTTPIYGLPYPQSSDLVSAYPALGQDLAEDLDGILAAKAALAGATYTGTHDFTGATLTGVPAPGLTLITAQAFSAASSVSVNNCFGAGYDNYMIVFDYTATASSTLTVRLRASGSDLTGGYYDVRGDTSASNATSWALMSTANGTNFFSSHISSPNKNALKVGYSLGHRIQPAVTADTYRNTFNYSVAAVADGLTLAIGSGSMNGTVRIYGLRN